MSGATTINFDSIRTIIKRSGNNDIKFKNCYGATESLGVVFTTNDFYDTGYEAIGIPVRGVSYKICSLDDEDVAITEPNIEGELVIKSDVAFRDVAKILEKKTYILGIEAK